MTDLLHPQDTGVQSENTQNTELLRHGSKLMMAAPISFGDFANFDTVGNPLLFNIKLQKIMLEYDGLFKALKGLVGSDNMTVIENYIVRSNGNVPIGTEVDFRNPNFLITKGPQGLLDQFNVQDYPLLLGEFKTWPKNAFSTPGGNLLLNAKAWSENIGAPVFNYIGDGGMILSHPQSKTVFIAEKIKEEAPEEVDYLRNLGVNIGVLPLVNPKGRGRFPEDDIDSFSLLINNNGKDFLYVAKSYYDQPKARNPINKAVIKTGVTLRIIDDTNLPHLALNALVFDNGHTVIATDPESTLHTQLREDIGEDKITVVPPLKIISREGGGGVGCMTNILPEV